MVSALVGRDGVVSMGLCAKRLDVQVGSDCAYRLYHDDAFLSPHESAADGVDRAYQRMSLRNNLPDEV